MSAEGRPHALVVGGTGMLRGVVRYLADHGFATSVIARRRETLDEIAREAPPGAVRPLPVDYSDSDALRSALGRSVADAGPLVLAVTWIRPGAPAALDIVVELADAAGGEGATRRCRLFRILGSAAADPAIVRKGGGARYRSLEGIDYREIVLGFRVEGDRSRWNTNEEIAAGVIEAIEGDLPDHVVGVARPWEMNPRLRH